MPEATPPPREQDISLEEEPLKLGMQAISDLYAKELVIRTFSDFESWRTRNHDNRWLSHDQQYFAWMPIKTWQGTSIPRAALGVSLVFQQVEAALPTIEQALFDSATEWFQVEPEPGSQPEEARAIQNAVLYQLERANIRTECGLAFKDILLHGNGGVEISWNQAAWDKKKKGFDINWVDIRDFYIDPACPTPNIQDARSVIRRKLLTVDEVESLRGIEGMRIPDKSILVWMSENSTGVMADTTKRSSEALRNINYNPSQYETLPLPAAKQIEVLMYYDKTRIIWMFNRDWVAYNEKNPYGCYPFFFAPCFNVLGRFYGMAFSDVMGDYQRYIEALLNAHLDEISLSIHPPRVSQRGGNMTAQQTAWRPGLNMQVDDPKSVQLLQPQPMTTNISDEITYLEILTEKATGVNSVGMGVPRGGNVNRTLGGVQSQLAGSSSRLQKIVGHCEDYLLVPLLEMSYKMLQYHLQPGELVPILGESQRFMQVGKEVFDGPMRFKMLSASRMMTREKVQQVFPVIMQFMAQGPMVEGLAQTGLTIDWQEMLQMMQDATGTERLYKLVRPMNQQEQQARQAPPPEAQMEMQKAQQEAQTRIQMGQMKAQTDMAKIQADQDAQEEETNRFMIEQIVKQALEREKNRYDIISAQADAQSMREKAAIEREMAQQKMFIKALESKQQLQTDAMKAQHEITIAGLKTQAEAQMSQEKVRQSQLQTDAQAQQHQQGLEQNAQTHAQKLKLTREAMKEKAKMNKEKQSSKGNK